jgi:hypothetical protein
MATSNRKYIGTCTMCGKEDCELTIIDEVEHVCEECLDNEYIFCDECKEYWLYYAIKFYNLKDGRVLCEHCGEDIDEDEVDFIENYTGF